MAIAFGCTPIADLHANYFGVVVEWKKTLRTIFWRECKDPPQELSTSSIKERLAELVEIGGEMLKV